MANTPFLSTQCILTLHFLLKIAPGWKMVNRSRTWWRQSPKSLPCLAMVLLCLAFTASCIIYFIYCLNSCLLFVFMICAVYLKKLKPKGTKDYGQKLAYSGEFVQCVLQQAVWLNDKWIVPLCGQICFQCAMWWTLKKSIITSRG